MRRQRRSGVGREQPDHPLHRFQHGRGIEGGGLDHGIGDAAPRQILHVELSAIRFVEAFRQHAGKRQAQHEQAALLFRLREKARIGGGRRGGLAHHPGGGIEQNMGAGMAMKDMQGRRRRGGAHRLALNRAFHSQSFIYSAKVGLLRSVLMATAEG